MNDETMILCIHLEFDNTSEYMMWRIRKQDFAIVTAIIRRVKDYWWEMSDINPDLTYDEAIENEMKKAHIWFQTEEYDVVYVDYFN